MTTPACKRLYRKCDDDTKNSCWTTRYPTVLLATIFTWLDDDERLGFQRCNTFIHLASKTPLAKHTHVVLYDEHCAWNSFAKNAVYAKSIKLVFDPPPFSVQRPSSPPAQQKIVTSYQWMWDQAIRLESMEMHGCPTTRIRDELPKMPRAPIFQRCLTSLAITYSPKHYVLFRSEIDNTLVYSILKTLPNLKRLFMLDYALVTQTSSSSSSAADELVFTKLEELHVSMLNSHAHSCVHNHVPEPLFAPNRRKGVD